MNWNIAEQLPETMGCRNSFNTVIAGYIHTIYLKLKEEQTQPSSGPALSQPHLGLAANEKATEFAREVIGGEISQNLFQITEKLNNRLQKNEDGTHPALEFTKAICHVLSLDPAVSETVYQLKINLLRLIGTFRTISKGNVF